MNDANPCRGTIMRLFRARAKNGRAAELLEKFATTSVDVVQDEPGNEGYFFGRGAALNEDTVMFASFWKDLDAVKQRFGPDWQRSFLPPGYEDLMVECSVEHICLSSGWQEKLPDGL